MTSVNEGVSTGVVERRSFEITSQSETSGMTLSLRDDRRDGFEHCVVVLVEVVESHEGKESETQFKMSLPKVLLTDLCRRYGLNLDLAQQTIQREREHTIETMRGNISSALADVKGDRISKKRALEILDEAATDAL